MAEVTDVERVPGIEATILTLRGVKVILDFDLARIYGVRTKRLNEQVRRNAERFPSDFMFQVTPGEARNLRSQIATSSLQCLDHEYDRTNRSQIATGSHNHRGLHHRPYAFTEHGAIMAAAWKPVSRPRSRRLSRSENG